VTRLAYTVTEAAEQLCVSLDFFNAYVRPELRLVRRGRKVLVPHTELLKWIDKNAALTLKSGSVT